MVNPRKVERVEEITEQIERSSNIIFTSFRGLTVEKMESLRRQLYECGTTYRVVKNRLARRAFSKFSENGDPAVAGETGKKTVGTEESKPTVEAELSDLPGVGPSMADDLEGAGLDSVAAIVSADEDELLEVPGIGPAKVEKITAAARELVDKETVRTEKNESTVEAELSDLPGVGPSMADDLEGAGLDSVAAIVSADEDELLEVPGIGPAKVEKITAAARELVGDGDEQEKKEEDSEQKTGRVGYPDVDSFLTGNTAIAFNREGVEKAAKVLVEFSEESEPFRIKGGFLENRVLELDDIEQLSELPSRRQLLTQTAMTLNSPLQKLARYLKDPLQKLVQVINKVKKSKEDSKE